VTRPRGRPASTGLVSLTQPHRMISSRDENAPVVEPGAANQMSGFRCAAIPRVKPQ
jgi:hypothetical protein